MKLFILQIDGTILIKFILLYKYTGTNTIMNVLVCIDICARTYCTCLT